MTALSRPSLDLYDPWADCIRDFGEEYIHGSGIWNITDGVLDPTRDACAFLVEKARQEADLSRPPAEGRVHCDQFWITQDDGVIEVIGFVSFRHSLDNEFLRTEGGHIGYSIRPSYRRQGHASRALGLALERAREIGLDRVLITCDEDNLGSARTIESQGGVFESMCGIKRRYWISL
ncbi:GNAT family N-acetyltransferase [Nocardioides sp. CER19]|uniref:GNAT family N-acetyltransferase n=1 Tax=Nocardioides sp. CER19 TaxID=3038538 RepID=UPI0024495EB7|nr:GNAT family N-acetyltransferase [Nocardioides sp. CER19]MDH2412598.1 GNAT family N-acetyltransferase [Nocardioides sp. CER19]